MTPTTLFLLVVALLGVVSEASSRSIFPALAWTQSQPQVKVQKLYNEHQIQADDCGEAFVWCVNSGRYSHRLCLRGLEKCIPVLAQLLANAE